MEVTSNTPRLDDIGVNVHSSYAAYKDRIPALTAKLTEAGFSWIRDNNPRGAQLWKNAGYKGKVLVVIGSVANVQIAKDNGADVIDPVNEIDPTNATQRQLALDIQAECVRLNIPCLSTSLANPTSTNADALGLQPNARRANVHCYRAMRSDSSWASRQISFCQQAGKAALGRANWVTETGYHDYLVPGKTATYVGTENANHQMTPDSVAAQTIESDVLGFFACGAEKVFLYELVDQWAYRTLDGVADHEGYYGLLKNDLTWKPQGTALINWMASLVVPVVDNTQAIADLQTKLDSANSQLSSTIAQLTNAQQQLSTQSTALAASQAEATRVNTLISNFQAAHSAILTN